MHDAKAHFSLAATLGIYLLLPLGMNGLIFGLGWSTPRPSNPMLPPGWAVGSIWMLLFAAMGTARWLCESAALSGRAAHWIDALAILCLLYPLYTLGLRSDTIGLAGTIVTAIFAAAVIAKAQQASRPAAALTSAVLLWLVYAGIATARGLRKA